MPIVLGKLVRPADLTPVGEMTGRPGSGDPAWGISLPDRQAMRPYFSGIIEEWCEVISQFPPLNS